MKINICFIDASAWIAISDVSDPHHAEAQDYFKKLLESNVRLVTNNPVIDEALEAIKSRLGSKEAQRFLTIIDESILTINLRMDWISRRLRKNALNQLLRSKNPELQVRHMMINETIKRKKVDNIFTFDPIISQLGTPVVFRQ
jgi:predicted nucleic acid-binding protein